VSLPPDFENWGGVVWGSFVSKKYNIIYLQEYEIRTLSNKVVTPEIETFVAYIIK